jgi:hypothetical protein
MNDLVKQVTPLTSGIIWFVSVEPTPEHPLYSSFDYLLDGLLTANLKENPNHKSRVIVAESFHRRLFVMIATEAKEKELESFISLFEKDLKPENDILVIDETESFSKLKSLSKLTKNHLKLFQ